MAYYDNRVSSVIDRRQILAWLVSLFLAGADKPTLLQVAVCAQVDKEFFIETNRLQNQRTTYLDAGH